MNLNIKLEFIIKIKIKYLQFNLDTNLFENTLFHNFCVGHSRYECYYYSYPMKKSWKMGTFLENRILSLRKHGLVNVVYIEWQNMV